MQKVLYQTLAALAVASSPAWAQAPRAEAVAIEAKGETGGIIAQAVVIQATVTAIDKANRVVTVKGPDGKTRTFKVGEEARNFNQAEVGDILTLKYQEALALQLEKAPGAKPGMSVSEEMSRAKAGDKPGGMVQRTVTVVGTVTAIDTKAQRVTVRGPEGNELDIKVQDPAKLKNVKTGDLVSATYTEALVISVTTPAKAGATKK
jgi:Cu/Ag efflux protein CusF